MKSCWHRSWLGSWICESNYMAISDNFCVFLLQVLIYPILLLIYMTAIVFIWFIHVTRPLTIKVCLSFRKFNSQNGCRNFLLKLACIFYAIFVAFFFLLYGLMFDVMIVVGMALTALWIVPGYFFFIYYGIKKAVRNSRPKPQFEKPFEEVLYNFVEAHDRVTGV